jgi:hypothetical protein
MNFRAEHHGRKARLLSAYLSALQHKDVQTFRRSFRATKEFLASGGSATPAGLPTL